MIRSTVVFNFMISFIFILSSCTEAPTSGRGNNKFQSRKPTDVICTDNNTNIQCATTYSALMVSQMYHNIGVAQLSYLEEADHIKMKTLPKTYRTIPNPQIDNDNTVKHITIGADGEYAKHDCGISDAHSSILARRNDCFSVHENGAGTDEENGKSNWFGNMLTNSGEGQWKLVLRDNEKNITLWFDTRTKLIWSHALSPEQWSIASGVDQDSSASCHLLNELTKTTASPNGQIEWRLPNRNEFLQADLNGARFVLDGVDNLFWTASTTELETHAWVIKQSSGELFKEIKSSFKFVRCIGVEI